MFEKLKPLPADPILGLNQVFLKDQNPDKINLSIGVYQDSNGNTPIFSAVKQAEQNLLQAQTSKAYINQDGDPAFVKGITKLLLGDTLVTELGARIATIMTPGGCGGLRMGAELLAQSNSDVTVWVSDPTWANHFPLLQSAGLQLKTYSYYDSTTRQVNFAKMLDSISVIPQGDVVLLHGCCHNPTGADLSHSQWDQLVDVLAQRKLVPFIDVAYQGFGDSLDEDAYGVRLLVSKLPEVLIASSCSKNFGLYRERTGAVMVITETEQQTAAAKSHILSSARKSYSMSPAHGGSIVGTLLSDPQLTEQWKTELEQVTARMNKLRCGLSTGLNDAQSKIDFSFVEKSKGMFCYLGVTEQDVLHLRSEYGIYLLNSTRINIAGLSEANLPIIIDKVVATLNR